MSGEKETGDYMLSGDGMDPDPTTDTIIDAFVLVNINRSDSSITIVNI